MIEIIANTTIISNFVTVQRLDILHTLFERVYISTEVLAEISDGMAAGWTFYAGIETHLYPITPDGWLRLTSLETESELAAFLGLPASLHRGEASCIAIAANRGWAFLSDDSRARKAALDLGIEVSGTLGALVLAVQHAILDSNTGNTLLAEMIRVGYRSPFPTLNAFL